MTLDDTMKLIEFCISRFKDCNYSTIEGTVKVIEAVAAQAEPNTHAIGFEITGEAEE